MRKSRFEVHCMTLLGGTLALAACASATDGEPTSTHSAEPSTGSAVAPQNETWGTPGVRADGTRVTASPGDRDFGTPVSPNGDPEADGK